MREQSVDVTYQYSRHEQANFGSRGKKAEIATPSAAPTARADHDSAQVQLSEASGHGKEHPADMPHKPSPAEKAELDARGKTAEVVTVKAAPTARTNAAESDSALPHAKVADAAVRVRRQTVDMADGDSADEQANFAPVGEQTGIVAVGAAHTDYHSALLQIIESASNDPRQLRRLVYELARTNLNKEARQRSSALNPDDVRESVLALETAIARVEVGLSRGERPDIPVPRGATRLQRADDGLAREEVSNVAPRRIASHPTSPVVAAPVVRLASSWPKAAGPRQSPTWPRDRLVLRPDAAGAPRVELSAAPEQRAPVEIVYPERDKTDAVRVRRRVWLWFVVWPLIQLIGPAVFCLILYLAIAGRLDVQNAQTRQAIGREAQQSPPVEGARPSGLPLPSTYGVYAVSDGQLSELQALPIRAPDPRVQLSAEINKPSSTRLPDGKIVFVLFRRELLNSAPQKVAIRVVARVASTLTFSSGKAAAAKPDAAWHIRGNSYEFQVSPLNENREMVAVRSGDPDFVFPSGRYALVFEGLAYDFTVDGPITAAAQCLESFEAVSGPVFTECGPK
jgi:hypothetical protein